MLELMINSEKFTYFPIKTYVVGIHENHISEVIPGLSLELSDREQFSVIFRILGRSFGPNFGFPFMFYTLKLLTQLIIGRSEPVYGDFFSQIAL